MRLREIKELKKLPKSFGASINPKIFGEILFHKDNRTKLFLELPLNKRIALLQSVTNAVKRDIMLHMPEADLAEILQSVDPDDATDMLQLLTKRRRERVLQLLSSELKESISKLLEFDAETAAGLMTLDYVQVAASDNVATVAKRFREHEKRTGRPPVILAMQEDGRLAGFLPGHELAFTGKNEIIGKFVKRMHTLSYAATHDDVMDMFTTNPHAKVAVLNDSGAVVGIIYSDDVLRLMQENETSTLYDFAGIHEEESVTDSSRSKVKNRYRWLIVNLGTASVASFVVSRFESTLSTFAILAAFMPLVAGLSGNAATQAFAVIVRGIAHKQIELKTAWGTLRNELGAGAMNGVIIGSIMVLVVSVVTNNYKVGIVVGMAIIVNFLVAATLGTLMPLILSRLGKDPATSASIFITAGTDTFGFLVFLSLATVILT